MKVRDQIRPQTNAQIARALTAALDKRARRRQRNRFVTLLGGHEFRASPPRLPSVETDTHPKRTHTTRPKRKRIAAAARPRKLTAVQRAAWLQHTTHLAQLRRRDALAQYRKPAKPNRHSGNRRHAAAAKLDAVER